MKLLIIIKEMLGHCSHDWSPWVVTHRFTAEKTGTVKVVQERFCYKCKKTEITTDFS